MSSFAVGFPSRPSFTTANVGGESLRAQLIAFKTADTARISTAALANDPDLQIGLKSSARYLIEAELLVQLGVGVSGGVQFGWTYGGTIAAAYGRAIVTDATTINGGGNTRWRGTAFPAFVSSIANASFNAATELQQVYLQMLIQTTTAGNLALSWAQVVSTALNTTLNANSVLRATRIS